MGKQNNIYVKIQLEKDDLSGNIILRTQFDANAPNFFQDNNQISWCPTTEELEFLNEAFNLLSKKQRKQHSQNNNELSLVEETIDTIAQEEKNDSIQHDHQTEPPVPVLKADAAGIIVTSDSKVLDEIIKRKQNGEGVMVEADEETIVDKVLKQKKKGGKW